MKWILFFTFCICEQSFAATNTKYSVSLGKDPREVIFWQQRNIKTKNAYLIGYRAPSGKVTERVLPKEEYLSSVKELKEWRKKLIPKQTPAAGPFCDDQIVVNEGEATHFICLSGMDRQVKTKYLRWVRGQTNLITGRLW